MLVSYPELKRMGIRFSPKYIRLLVREGKFPKPVEGGREIKLPFKWRREDVLKWICSR